LSKLLARRLQAAASFLRSQLYSADQIECDGEARA
jgi:hypothetical protein